MSSAATMSTPIAIATPVATHYALAAHALRKGKQVLVEKPLCMRVDEAIELVELAEHHGLALNVDHVYVFHNAERKLKELKQDGALGTVSYYELESGAVPARRERTLGSRPARFLDHGPHIRRGAGPYRGDGVLSREPPAS